MPAVLTFPDAVSPEQVAFCAHGDSQRESPLPCGGSIFSRPCGREPMPRTELSARWDGEE